MRDGARGFGRFTVMRDLRKRVPLAGAGTGFTTVPDGRERVTVELWIDVERLARALGGQAAVNKSGRAKIWAGLIEARVVERERE